MGAVLSAGVMGYYWLWLYRPIGAGPAGPALPKKSFAQPWTPRRVFLIGFGDSVTAGYGARKGYSYFDLLVTNPPDEFPEMQGISLSAVLPNLQFTNLSMSGSTSLQHMKAQISRLSRQPEDVLGLAVITTGGNDIIHNYGMSPPREGAMYGATWDQAHPWIASFRTHLQDMLVQIEAAFPGGCHVFLADIYDPTDGLGDTEKAGLPRWPDGLKILKAYNEIIEEVASKNPHVHRVSIHSPFLGHGIHAVQFWRAHYHRDDPHYWFHENLEDPNERGYDALRRLFLQEITKAMLNPTNSPGKELAPAAR